MSIDQAYQTRLPEAHYRDQRRRASGILKEGLSILELGCGTSGGLASRVRGMYSITGMDIDLGSFSPLSELSGAPFVQSDILSAPFKTNAFDLLLAFDGLHHYFLDVKNLSLFFKEAARILKPGGEMFLDGVLDEKTAFRALGEKKIEGRSRGAGIIVIGKNKVEVLQRIWSLEDIAGASGRAGLRKKTIRLYESGSSGPFDLLMMKPR